MSAVLDAQSLLLVALSVVVLWQRLIQQGAAGGQAIGGQNQGCDQAARHHQAMMLYVPPFLVCASRLSCSLSRSPLTVCVFCLSPNSQSFRSLVTALSPFSIDMPRFHSASGSPYYPHPAVFPGPGAGWRSKCFCHESSANVPGVQRDSSGSESHHSRHANGECALYDPLLLSI